MPHYDHLVGQNNVRHLIDTPALMLERAAFEHNVALMAERMAAQGKVLRPHAKTHRCVEIAKQQIAAGAVGICCAKLGEAEIFASAGIKDILITSPVVTSTGLARLVALHQRTSALKQTVDDVRAVEALAALIQDKPLTVLIDIDPGIRRTGVVDAEQAVAVAEAVRASNGKLVYGGVQFYCGAEQHIEAFEERRSALAEREAHARQVIAALTQIGFAPPVVTGSGTGTHEIDLMSDFFTEYQCGSYIFMDRQYELCALGEAEATAGFQPALFVDASIIHAVVPGMVTIDTGYKALSTDGGTPRIVTPGFESAGFAFMGDEHGALFGYAALPQLGQRISMTPPHCDPTVNLYDRIFVMDGERLSAIWAIDARGASA